MARGERFSVLLHCDGVKETFRGSFLGEKWVDELDGQGRKVHKGWKGVFLSMGNTYEFALPESINSATVQEGRRYQLDLVMLPNKRGGIDVRLEGLTPAGQDVVPTARAVRQAA